MGSDTWNDAPSASDGAGWKPVDTGATGDGWQADGDAGGDGWTGEISEQNTSKHADGFDAPRDGGCRNCGADGHFARDCPEERREGGGGGLTGECFNCGEIGHNKADCTNPRVERPFTGTCNLCGQEGHRRAECPDKPADKCKICGDESHDKDSCTANRLLLAMEKLDVQDIDAEKAWAALVLADKEKEVEDIRKAIITYATTFPEVTFQELEGVFRAEGHNTYLVAKQQEVSDTHTIVNLQGKIDQKFAVSIQFSPKPRRAKFAEGWPPTPEENVERLAEAGFIMDRMVQKCTNCNQLGHGSRACPEEKQEKAKTVITCANCNEEGHYARDCKEARKSNKKGCRNCGSEEHIAKECDQPRSVEGVECKNCGEMGHFSKDCPSRAPDLCRNCGQEGHRKADCVNERVMQCRNCDEWGHSGRECPKPRDWSRVECRNCGEKGHGAARCQNPPKEPEAAEVGAGGDWEAGGGAATGGDKGWDDGAAANTADAGGDGWGAAPAAASGGW